MDNKYDTSILKHFSPSMQVGLILDVTNDVLDKLLRFDNQKNFLNNFFSVFDGEVMTLINGNEMIPYYDFNQLILTAIKYLNDENIIYFKQKEINSKKGKNLFDEKCLYEIVKVKIHMNSFILEMYLRII